MPLKAVVTNDDYDGLNEARQADYRAAQGGENWILDIEGVDDHPTVKGLAATLRKYKEISPSATALKKTLTDLEALKGLWVDEHGQALDPDITRDALKKLAELESGDGKVDVEARIKAAQTVVEKRFEKMLADKTTENQALLEQVGGRDTYIESLIVKREIEEGLKHIGVIEDLRHGARSLIMMDYGPKVERTVDEETGKVSYAGVIRTDVGEVSIPDFFARWATEEQAQPFLPPSGNQGTRSFTEDGKGTKRRINPWMKDTFNLTEQGRIHKENPTLAKTLASAAGVKLDLS